MLKKALRSIQSSIPGSRELKNEVYFQVRKRLRVPHESDFKHIAALPQRADDLFLDIGGNWGQSIMAMRLVRPTTPIISFEPISFMFAEIRKRLSDDGRLTVHNVGLGDTESTATFYTPVYNGFIYDGLTSSDRKSAEEWLNPETMFFFDPKKLEIREQVCTVRTLDSFGLAPTFIKIDVQGMEDAVIAGGTETIRKHRPVILLERDEKGGPVARRLEGLGYVEAVPQGGRFVAGSRTSMNAFWMTEETLGAIARRT
jgi:FkbM family methyltransferase